ncbi:MAG: phosphatidate cytidylyltransferase, partial [Pseudomonadota bacterium]|nr:phosphatidate cytidylyltransferase [Pseudomonadota bacterium]
MAVKGRDIALRAASAAVLAPAAVAATWIGGVWFLALITAASVVLAFEWAAMSAPHARRLIGGAVSLGVVAAVVSAYFGVMSVAFVMLVFGAAAAGLYARSRGQQALDAAYGVLYLGWPSVLLIWLRDVDATVGLHWTVLVFAVAWSADILAYLAGSTFGGPKLWPRFSPNKTWSGFVGGILAGAVAGAVMTAWFDMGRLTVFWGGVLGLAAALATMAG